ncbi:MAG: TonB-dependent receptor [Acidobacteriota bacterium]
MANASGWRLSTGVALVFLVAGVGVSAVAQEKGPAPTNAVAQEQQQAPEQKPKEEVKPTPRPESDVVKEFAENIVVTAQKRAENEQDVPISLTAVTAEDFRSITAGGPDIVQLLSGRIPSLTLETSFGRAFPRFYIRGMGNTDFDLNASQPVSMVVDDVVLENPVVKGMPLWDLERIEVLRGPQGTLFGRNTPAGVVKFETKKPTRDLDASFRVSYGTFNTIDVSGGVGGPISDTLAIRFSALHQSRSNWVDNDFRQKKDALGHYDENAYRLQLLWAPSDKFSGLFNVHGWDLDGTARIFRANIIKKGTNDFVDGFEQDVVYHDGRNKQDISARGASLRFEYDFGPAALTSITAYEGIDHMYSRGDIDGGYGAVYAPPYGPGFIPFVSETADGIPHLDQFTQELRVASNSAGPFNWLAGLFYFHEQLKAETFDYNSLAPGNPQDAYAFQSQATQSYAAFASLDYQAAEKWLLKAGLRFTHEKKDFSAERPEPTFLNTVTVAPITAHTDASNVSGDFSVIYKSSPDFHVYGRLATGFRAPSIQGRILFCGDPNGGQDPATNCVSTADTEKITSAEVGFKSILADNRLKLNLTAYAYRVKGQQVTAVGGKYNTATLLNVDHTDGHGLEADIEYVGSEYWWTTLGVSYNPTKIRDRNLTVTPCAGGCTVLNPTAPNGGVYVDGNSLPNAPDWIINNIINVQSSAAGNGFFGTLDWAYSSNKSFFLYESKEFNSDSLEFGLRLGYRWNAGRYEVALFSRNLFDKKILQGGIDFDNLTGMTNEPRTVGLEFIGRF